MQEQDKNIELPEEEQPETVIDDRQFALKEFKLDAISSAEVIKERPLIEETFKAISAIDVPETDAAKSESTAAADPIFAELAAPKLPELSRENRARLQMQSPTRLNFYWSVKQNPYRILDRAFGGHPGSYTLVARLVNRTNEREELFPVEAEGSWWFNVDADSTYRAEIGFYAPNRPFVRVMFSNTVETPRKNPSPRRAGSADWAVSANQFAEVLDVSGFQQDAFEVALAGDDFERTETATTNAFSQFIGRQKANLPSDEIRFALLALASGYLLEQLREQIGASLYAVLQENAEKLSAENALASLQENFEVFSDEIFEEEIIGSAVFGASLVNFPKTLRKRQVPTTLSPKGKPKLFRKLSPVSSFSLK